MYIYIYICIHVIYIYIYIFIYLFVYLFICLFIYIIASYTAVMIRILWHTYCIILHKKELLIIICNTCIP